MVKNMSNYYSYREVKVMIAHKLMSMEGWKVYGYKADESDSMTDYWSPAHWDGVAEKNGYVFCVDVYGAAAPQEIRKYNHSAFTYDKSIAEKIKKLEAMTVDRGASEAEEESAKMMIQHLQKKAEESAENAQKYIVVGTIPGHMAHPPKMNWHIEKDGVIIAKGNGILKYASVWNYYNYESYMQDMKAYKKDKKAYAEANTQDLLRRGYHTNEADARANTERQIEKLEEDIKLIDKFEAFINKIDTTCGGLLGDGDISIYEKVTVTEYKTEYKAVEDTSGSLKEGQCFILKSNFNYGRDKGYTYRIHEITYDDGQKRYHAYKLNGKKTKECTGQSNHANYWYIYDTEKFLKWFEQGAIAWCHIAEVKTPYEVEKVVKKVVKAEKKVETAATKTTEKTTEATKTVQKEAQTIEEASVSNYTNYTYKVSEDTDTRTGERIFLVKVAETLSREEFLQVNKYIRSLGGYYSKFKHSFLFKEDPTERLGIKEDLAPTMEISDTKIENVAVEITEDKSEENRSVAEDKKEPAKEAIAYTITEDKHTQTDAKIWIVKPEKQLNKTDFAEIKRKLATLQGYYSTFKKGFIFKYDPTEKLQTG